MCTLNFKIAMLLQVLNLFPALRNSKHEMDTRGNTETTP